MNKSPVMMEALEERQLCFADPSRPYPVTNAALKGQFVSAVPKTAVGGTTLPVWFKVINRTNERQTGLIDLSFMLHVASSKPVIARAADKPVETATVAVGKTVPAGVATKTQANVLLDIKPRGSQVFKYTGTIPKLQQTDYYYFLASVDPGGAMEATPNVGYVATITASDTPSIVYIPATDVNVNTFHFSLNLKAHTGVFTGTLKNFSVDATGHPDANIPANGTLSLSLFATRSKNDDPSLHTALDVANGDGTLAMSITSLGAGRAQRVTIKFNIPSSLNGNFILGVKVSRGGEGGIAFSIPDYAGLTSYSSGTVTIG